MLVDTTPTIGVTYVRGSESRIVKGWTQTRHKDTVIVYETAAGSPRVCMIDDWHTWAKLAHVKEAAIAAKG